MDDKQAFAYRGSAFFLAVAGVIAWAIRQVGQGEGLWTAWLYIFAPAWFIFVGVDLIRHSQRRKRLSAIEGGENRAH